MGGAVEETESVEYYHCGTGELGLLLVPDVWGWNGERTRAIADDFAQKGLNVWVPKILQPALEGGTDGDGLPPDFNVRERGREVGPLFAGDWSAEKVLPQVKAIVEAMKADGVKKYGFLGFCYGAWVGFHLSKAISGEELICGMSPHPSVHIEQMLGGDPAGLAKEVNCPWALYPCGDPGAGGDSDIYDPEGTLFRALEDKFPGKNVTKRYSSMQHGFVSRGAIKDGSFKAGDGDDVRKAVQDCVDDMIGFLAKNELLGDLAESSPKKLRSEASAL